MPVLPEIDAATEKAMESSPAQGAAIVNGYRRLISSQLSRIRSKATTEVAASGERALAQIYADLLGGLDQLLTAWENRNIWQTLDCLRINVARFNDEALQRRLDPVFTTQRPAPGDSQRRAETEQMRTRIAYAIGQLQERITGRLDSPEVMARIAANFPTEAAAQAAANIRTIVSNLAGLAKQDDGFLPNYDLPSNTPALQTVVNQRVVIMIHPAAFINLPSNVTPAVLMHEGAHAIDPAGIADYLYRNTGLHRELPAPLALGNAASYEQVAVDLLGVGPDVPTPSGSGLPQLRAAAAYATLRVTRAAVAALSSASRTRAGQATESERRIARILGAPLGLGTPGADPVPVPLPIDKKLMSDASGALSVLMSTVRSLRLGPPRQGPPVIERPGGRRQPPVLRPGEPSHPAAQEELQARILEQLCADAERTGGTSHLTAHEILAVINSTPDLLTASEKGNLRLLADSAEPARLKNQD